MVKVRVEQGWLEGETIDLVTEDGQYYSFKGIPYAEPPIGDLRFKDPTPPKNWDGMRQAATHGPVCYQKDIISNTIINGSEDCLYLNVYSTNLTPSKLLPVMVFIHGGGFKSGSGNSDFYGPDFLVRENVILVTINYRLEVLGFLCLNIPEAPGNAGLKDQVAALKWVKRNISHFGGDPNCITLFGESAGAACVGFHIFSPMSKHLINRVILMSGTPFSDWCYPFEPQKKAFVLGKQLGFNTEDPQKLFHFLQKLPVEKLIDTTCSSLASEILMHHPFKSFSFVPVIEKDFGQNYFLNEEPLKLLKSGCINKVDVIVGYTKDEAIVGLPIFKNQFYEDYLRYIDMFVPRRIYYQKSPVSAILIAEDIMKFYFGSAYFCSKKLKEFIKYLTDDGFIYKAHKFIDDMEKANKGKNYLYNFTAYSERNLYGNQKDTYNIVGTAHLDDLLYIFNPKCLNLPLCKKSQSYKMIKQLSVLFTNFAKYGNPTPNTSLGATWLPYNPENQNYLDIGEELMPGKGINKDIIEFWDNIYDKAGISYGYFLEGA